MAADPYYQNLERQLRDTRMRINSAFDKPNDPTARIIHNELQKAEDMAQNSHNLRTIEERLKTTQRLLNQAERMSPTERIMNPEHASHYYDHLDQMRGTMRRHPLY